MAKVASAGYRFSWGNSAGGECHVLRGFYLYNPRPGFFSPYQALRRERTRSATGGKAAPGRGVIPSPLGNTELRDYPVEPRLFHPSHSPRFPSPT